MTDQTQPTATSDANAEPSGSPALLTAFRDVLTPLARLAVSRGVRHGELDELLKSVLIDAARQAHADVPLQRAVSRISAATGINRREVTRLTQTDTHERSKPRSAVNEVFARWLTDPAYAAEPGQRRILKRLGAPPSFESLAESVNRDVRPRTLLEELCRLGIACINEEGDTVELLTERYVPSSDETEMLAYLGANVGDHLHAAVDNVTSCGVRHLEQAIFTDQVSARSIEEMRPQVQAQWKALVQKLAPAVQQLMDQDIEAARPQDHRLRIGVYMYTTPLTTPFQTPLSPAPSKASRKPRSKP